MAVVRPQTDGDRAKRDYTIPAGRYAIGAVSFERKDTKNKNPPTEYIRTKYYVIGPRQVKGKHFYDTTSLDLTKNGTCVRWQIWMDAVGVVEPVDLGEAREMTHDEGNANIRRYFMGRGFMAEVTRTVQGAYTNNGIAKIFPPDKWSEKETEAIRNWESAQAQKALEEAERAPDFGDEEKPEQTDDWGDDETSSSATDEDLDGRLDPEDDEESGRGGLGW